MPANWGVYEYGATEGTEVSSTYEGRHITCTAAELITDGGSGTAVKGHACVFGLVGLQAVGVCFNSGTLTDLIAIDTEGIWNLPVYGKDDGGDRVLSPGEPVFIDVADCEISGERNNATQIPFGYLLTEVASGVETISVVKVHWDPRAHWLMDEEPLLFGDGQDWELIWNNTEQRLKLYGSVAAPNFGDGYGGFDVCASTTGEAAGHIAGVSGWLNMNGTVAVGGLIVAARSDGVYIGGDSTNALIAYGGRLQYEGDNNASYVSVWSVNMSGGDTCDGVFSKVNGDPSPELGYIVDATTDDGKIGAIPFFVDMNTGTQYWIRIYDGGS